MRGAEENNDAQKDYRVIHVHANNEYHYDMQKEQ